MSDCIRKELVTIKDNPSARLKVREDFYSEYGHPQLAYVKGLGDSELSFIKWEINRGVLNPRGRPRGRSCRKCADNARCIGLVL